MEQNDAISFVDKVTEDLILLNIPGNSRDEALKYIADLFMEKGIAKPTFYEALLQRENEYPTGLPIGEINFAIPHTYPEHINRIAVCVATLQNTVIFKNMGNPEEDVPVRVIVCLALKKMDDNIKMLPTMMDFFADEENLRKLLAAENAGQVMALLKAV